MSDRDTIKAYWKLVEWAQHVAEDYPWRKSIDGDAVLGLTFDAKSNEYVLQWQEYESDYYGGGYNRTETVNIPAAVFDMVEEQRQEWIGKMKAEEKERDDRRRKAEDAVHRSRREEADREQYQRLYKKYGGKVPQ